VPDPVRAEFVNVGTIAGCDGTVDWSIRTLVDYRRARHLDSDNSLDIALTRLNELQSLFEAQLELDFTEFRPSRKYLNEHYQRSKGCIQFSRPLTILADSADEALEKVCDRFLVDTTRKTKEKIMDRRSLQRIVRLAYHKAGLKESVLEKACLESENYKGAIDFAVRNGKAAQLAQTWSFLIDPDTVVSNIKEWAWNLNDVRKAGGRLVLGEVDVLVKRDVPLEVVYARPETDRQAEAFIVLKKTCKALDAKLTPFDQVDELGEKARALLKP
jgi:DUF3037 family protein